MKPKSLTFYADPTDDKSLVLDHDRFQNTSVISYVGRKLDKEKAGYPATHQPYVVKTELCYIKPAKSGFLIPGDKETADYVGVKFDPKRVKDIQELKE